MPPPQVGGPAAPPPAADGQQRLGSPPPAAAASVQSESAAEQEADEDDDSKETCGFCRFMKGGGCRSAFIVSAKLRRRHRALAAPTPRHPAHLERPMCGSHRLQAWSECVDHEREAGSDFTEECREKVGAHVAARPFPAAVTLGSLLLQTLALRECMLRHADYYRPLLEEEEEMMSEQAGAPEEHPPSAGRQPASSAELDE